MSSAALEGRLAFSSLLLLGALVAFSSAASYVKRPLDLSPYEQLYKPSLPVYESVSPVYEAPLPPVYTAPGKSIIHCSFIRLFFS